jgi:serine/threonine-protein kinase
MANASSEVPAAELPVSVGKVAKGKRYKVHGELGRGGMGEVRYVVDRWLRRGLAMKLLGDDMKDDHDSLTRFVEEAQITGQLDHPNIVPVYELGRTPAGEPFFTMKRVRGVTFADAVLDLGAAKLSVDNLERLVDIVIRVCDALEFAHSRGVVHRDIKPTNVMIGDFGQVFLLDWGLAQINSSERLTSDKGRVVGTPGFMAPEQALQEHVDERCDIYALGGLLYCVLSDRMPHPGRTAQARLAHTRAEPVSPPNEVRSGADLPPELCRIAMKALAREPDARYASVADLRKDLRQFQRGGGWLHTREITAGTEIIREGDDAANAYIVVSGVCEAVHVSDGKRRVLRRMGPGEVFGETALLTGRKRTASVYAVDDVVLKVVTRASLDRELQRSSWVHAIVRVLAERFGDVDERLRALERNQP